MTMPPYGGLNFAPVHNPNIPQPQLGDPGTQAAKLNGLLPQPTGAAPIDFETVAPGSRIAVFAPGFEYGERCTVIRMESEWGPVGVPALHLLNDATKEKKLLPSSVQGARIEVIISAEQLGIERAPEDAIRARTRPLDVIAMQWKGGAAGAAQIMMWSTGHLVLQYDEGNEGQDESLKVQKLDQTAEDYMRPGDYLIKAPDGAFRIVLEGEFKKEFEEVSIVG